MSELAKVDRMIGSSAFAINLFADPPEKARAALSEIQDLIVGAVPPDTLFRCPAFSLHLSVFQFVHARKVKSNHDAREWDNISEDILMYLGSAINEARVFTLKSPSIQVSESAIFLQFVASSEIDSLRDRLTVVASKTKLSWNRPGIQHVSIFRFLKPAPLNKIQSHVGEIKMPDIEWTVCDLQLARENIYPSLDITLIQNLPLLSSHEAER